MHDSPNVIRRGATVAQVLTTSRADFADFAERLRGAKLAASVFASADAIEKANAKRAEDAQLPVKPLA